MAVSVTTIGIRELADVRARLRRCKYRDLYDRLEAGQIVQVTSDDPDEIARVRLAAYRWLRRHGVVAEKLSTDRILVIAPLQAAGGPRIDADLSDGLGSPSATAGPPQTPAPATLHRSWERAMRPPDPPPLEKLMGGQKKSS